MKNDNDNIKKDKIKQKESKIILKNIFKDIFNNITKTLYIILPIIFLAILLWLPSYFDFAQHKPLKLSVLRTSIFEFLIIYLIFLIIIFLFFYYELKIRKIYLFSGILAILILLKIANFKAPIFIFAVLITSIFIFFRNLSSKIKKENKKEADKDSREKIFSILLLVCAFALLLIIEYIYLYDVLAITWSRMNTVFKIGIQIWILLGISCSYFLFYLSNKVKWKKIFSVLVVLLIILGVGYPLLATASKRTSITGTLDGLAYLKQEHPSDYALIEWLNENVKGKATILESIEPDYYYTSPIASFTGLNSVIAWPGHEIQWNIIIVDEITERIADVNETYSTLDTNRAKQLLEKYKVNYVIVGENEYKKYSQASLDKFKFLELIYENEKGKIYKVSEI